MPRVLGGAAEPVWIINPTDTTSSITNEASDSGTQPTLTDALNNRVLKTDDIVLQSYTDGTRPTFGVAGRIIFNTTDGLINVDTGTAWTLADGTVT